MDFQIPPYHPCRPSSKVCSTRPLLPPPAKCPNPCFCCRRILGPPIRSYYKFAWPTACQRQVRGSSVPRFPRTFGSFIIEDSKNLRFRIPLKGYPGEGPTPQQCHCKPCRDHWKTDQKSIWSLVRFFLLDVAAQADPKTDLKSSNK